MKGTKSIIDEDRDFRIECKAELSKEKLRSSWKFRHFPRKAWKISISIRLCQQLVWVRDLFAESLNFTSFSERRKLLSTLSVK